MNLIQFCIEKRVTVIVGVVFILLFGWLGLTRMPYQLSPTVVEPEISVTTNWQGATPYEVERDIIEEQEKVLKGIPGLIEMESTSSNSQGTVTLKFAIGTDLNSALLRVSNKLDEVPSYPENVEKPIITATGSATSPVVWMVLKTVEGNSASAYTYLTYFENYIRQYLERTPGVAELFIGGGTEKELHIEVSAERLAAHGLTIPRLIEILRAENVDIAAGTLGVGRRDYRIRTTAEFRSKEEIEDVIVFSTGQRRVRLADIATVRDGYEKRAAATLHMGREGIAIGVKPEPDANILELTDQLLLGSVLAIIVLMVFLRRIASTLVVAAAIPVSAVGTFAFMDLLGRNLNVVSLAGIAFAAGMLVDNAIVVLENIDRHRSMGKRPYLAA